MASDKGPPPDYSLKLFLEFLDYRGILRKLWVKRSRPTNHLLRLIHFQVESDSDDDPRSNGNNFFMTEENDIENYFLDSINAYQADGGTAPKDPDNFYNQTQAKDAREFQPDDDSCYKYISNGVESDRRYSNNSERRPTLLKDVKKMTTSIQDAYNEWERRLAILNESGLTNEAIEETDYSEGGLYDPFRPGLSNIATDSASSLLQLAPATKYRDLLQLNYMGSTTLNGLTASRRYKNNLSTIVHDAENTDLLLVACVSEILVYGFDSILHQPKEKETFRFETRPTGTTNADGNLLTWPYYPHTINFMRGTDDWLHGSAVGICTDDGSVLIWHVSKLRQELKKRSNENRTSYPRLYNLRITADIILRLGMSAWGLDFASAVDNKGEKHFVAVASSNSQTATLFYLDKGTGEMSSVETLELLHNIPEVSIIDYTIEQDKHVSTVSCSSISGELIVFRFSFYVGNFATERSTDSPTELEWPKRQGCALFYEPQILHRTNLDSECWTTKPVATKYFKLVQSLKAMTGDPFVDDQTEISHILTESAILNLSPDPLKTADLGGASRFQFFDSPVVCLAGSGDSNLSENNTSKFGSREEEYQRIHQAYKSLCSGTSDVLHNTILAISTDSRLGLFRADTLFCTSATRNVFTLNIPENEETRWCKRILITHVVKELLCFIAVSQQGLVTIMRLCEHRGLFGMRQEYLFPNALSLSIAESNLRSITGLAVRNLSIEDENLRFFLYIIYSDGLVLTYELKDHRDSVLDIDF